MLPAKTEAIMERRESKRNGRILLDEVIMSNDIASIKIMIADGDGVYGTEGGSVCTEMSSGQTLRLLLEFSHGGNDYRHVLPS